MAKPNREVTEFDLRAPEFQHPSVKPEDYEFRDDGKVVRKDRWETTVRNIVSALGWSRRDFELPEVAAEVRRRLDCGIDGDEEYDSWVITPDGVAGRAGDPTEQRYRDKCPDGLRCLNGCLMTEPCWHERQHAKRTDGVSAPGCETFSHQTPMEQK